MNIWTLGDAVVDLLPLSDMQYQACAGGAPFNVAIGAARLGCQSGFIGRVGEDDFGYFLKKTLSDAGVSTESLQLDNQHRTSTVLVSLGRAGERGFTFLTNPSADQFLTPDALPDFSDDILHFCSLALVAETCRHTLVTAISHVKQRGGLLSFDVNLREQMWPDKHEMLETVRHFAAQADILKLSEEEWHWMTGSHDFSHALNALNALPAQLKVVTYGEQGAMVPWCCGATALFISTVIPSTVLIQPGLATRLSQGCWPGLHIAGCRRMLNNSTSPLLRPAPAVPSRQRAKGR